MKISQKDVILIISFHLSKLHGAQRLFSDFADNGWKLGSSASLANNFVVYNKSCCYFL